MPGASEISRPCVSPSATPTRTHFPIRPAGETTFRLLRAAFGVLHAASGAQPRRRDSGPRFSDREPSALPLRFEMLPMPQSTQKLPEGAWRNGSASDSTSEGWEFESLCAHFSTSPGCMWRLRKRATSLTILDILTQPAPRSSMPCFVYDLESDALARENSATGTRTRVAHILTS